MQEVISWLESHEKLAGWAQALGAVTAILVAYVLTILQARYAVRHDARRTADRLRALARMLFHWRDLCERSHAIREHEAANPNVEMLNANLFEFNYTAEQVNRFGFADAPNELVLGALVKYRAMCGPLSTYMNPSHGAPLSSTDLKSFMALIGAISELGRGLQAEAECIAR